MADGFLGRWSQRKRAAQEGRALDEPPPAPVAPSTLEPPDAPPAPAAAASPVSALAAPVPPPALPTLTLEDVEGLTAESSYAPFVARNVTPAVRNAAMKKLFTDPHYNVMDRLDIYIDDYSKPDPLPAAMLRQMTSAKFLKLFEEEEKAEEKVESTAVQIAAPPADPAASTLAQDAAASDCADHPLSSPRQPPAPDFAPLTENQPPERGADHDHTDLRLQPNHAAGPPQPGRGAQ